MVETKTMRKTWVNEYVTAKEIKEINEPKERIITIKGEGEVKKRITKSGDEVFELHLPIIMGGNDRKLKIGQWEEKFFDYLKNTLGSDTKDWVNANIMLNYGKKGDYPVIEGSIVKHPLATTNKEVVSDELVE